MEGDKQLLIDSQVEEYEISLRKELDKISHAGTIAEKTSSFRETLLKKELSDLERNGTSGCRFLFHCSWSSLPLYFLVRSKPTQIKSVIS